MRGTRGRKPQPNLDVPSGQLRAQIGQWSGEWLAMNEDEAGIRASGMGVNTRAAKRVGGKGRQAPGKRDGASAGTTVQTERG